MGKTGNVSTKDVAEGVILFAEEELIPALDGWHVWAATAALVLVRQRVDVLLSELTKLPLVTTLGLVDKDGLVDVDAAIGALKEAARKHGKLDVDIPVLGIAYNFTEKNVEALRGYIDKASGA